MWMFVDLLCEISCCCVCLNGKIFVSCVVVWFFFVECVCVGFCSRLMCDDVCVKKVWCKIVCSCG